MHIKAYSELLVYLAIFRTIGKISQFQARYSGITQDQFMLILAVIQIDSSVFRPLAYLRT